MAEYEEREPGHAEALGALVVERYAQMVGYARKRLRLCGVPLSSADPEDLVQNVLMSVLAHTAPIENLRPYVFTAIRNEVRRAALRCHGGQAYASLDADIRLETAGTVDPCDTADLRLEVKSALSSLPPKQRESVWCNKMLGLTQAETAEVMGAAPGTVATHVSRAVVALRGTLGAVLTVVLSLFAAAWVRTGTFPVLPAAGGDLTERLEDWVALWGWPGLVVAAMTGAFVAFIVSRAMYTRYLGVRARLRSRRAGESHVVRNGEKWIMRQAAVTTAENRAYRCSSCDHVIPSGTPHVVAWPASSGADNRRHWHTSCWRARERRTARLTA
ncbi:sigma-70 family RNA polymerase sigma factor [Streptomyces glaucescens]|uniref:RNA polymerase sigma factor n=1 Tax=Streptomyces glaucescens TaxID=1907 RepID=UPI00344F705D